MASRSGRVDKNRIIARPKMYGIQLINDKNENNKNDNDSYGQNESGSIIKRRARKMALSIVCSWSLRFLNDGQKLFAFVACSRILVNSDLQLQLLHVVQFPFTVWYIVNQMCTKNNFVFPGFPNFLANNAAVRGRESGLSRWP